MAGVRFAGNRVHRQWSEALRLDAGGFESALQFPFGFAEWVWRAADALPPGRADAKGEVTFRRRLQGRAVRATLGEVGAAFSLLRSVLEPVTLSLEPDQLDDVS